MTIVRILLKNPSLLILDEATANIDPFTEHYIKEALQLAMKGRTSIIIAHRLSTIREADKIVVLASGRKLEEGTHEQLIQQEGAYKKLYDVYYRHQQEENDASIVGM
ncbi:putative multidrug export ATP-binding/permease protein [compost metagenome]